MSLKERVYSVLVVSASETLNEALHSILSESRYNPAFTVSSIGSAKRMLAERSFDFIIINSPLPDDVGIRLAIDMGGSKDTVVLLLSKSEVHDEIYDEVAEHGVFTLPKPTSKALIANALNWMSVMRERIRKNNIKTLSVEEKMEEIRVVNRAKWMLISKCGMSEEDAHRLIEKQAMDRCVPKKEIAETIISKYS
ncbi:MAG: response regulator [Clostridia bacterium]|nr:response regulator [Clostridia bacterium]